MFHVDHTIASQKQAVIRVHLLRSDKPQRCPACGLRRILYAIALYPAGLSPETWACAEDTGIRVPGASVAPSPVSGGPTLWDEEATEEQVARVPKVEDFVASVTSPEPVIIRIVPDEVERDDPFADGPYGDV